MIVQEMTVQEQLCLGYCRALKLIILHCIILTMSLLKSLQHTEIEAYITLQVLL